jgi:thioredoxin 1
MIHFENVEAFNSFMKREGFNKSMIIDFHAQWCGPCKAIAPMFSDFSDMYKNITFAKVDIDEAEDIADLFGVSSLPTFVLVKNGNEVTRLTGSSRSGLENLVRKAL